MGSFTLLTVLGSGSCRLSCHHRLPLAAYQAGSILVVWDFTRFGDDSRQFILLQPGQRCSQIFFSKDGRFVLGFWVSPSGQPTLSVWRTADGVRVAEHALANTSAQGLCVDYHRETQHLLVLYGNSALSACVAYWDADVLSPRPLAQGSLGPSSSPLAVRLLDDARHFAVAEVDTVAFWTYAGPAGSTRQVLRVDLTKPLQAFELEGRLAYLLTEGRLQVMNFEGQREQVVQAPTAKTTCMDAKASTVCIGCEDGSLLVSRSASPEHWKSLPCPPQLCDTSGIEKLAPRVVSVSLGASEDYACVCFSDATHGVIHLSSAQWVALRAGHAGNICSITTAPRLTAPASLAGRMLDAERILKTKALAFLSIGSQRPGCAATGLGFIAWPKMGPPTRGCLARGVGVPVLDEEQSLIVTEGRGRALTAAAFHPSACLALDGSLNGTYVLVAGAEDGSVHLLEALAPASADQAVTWRTVRSAPRKSPSAPSEVFPREVGDLEVKSSGLLESCCHLTISSCGSFIAASFADGAADLLEFPTLNPLLQLQHGEPSGPRDNEKVQKAFFVWRPTATQRAYDQNLYVVSRLRNPWEAVLHEVYPLGDSFAKAPTAQFALAPVCQAAGGVFTDLCAHPSQLYLVASAVLPSSDVRSIILVFDLWSGELLKSCPVFNSLLVAPLLPLHPSICLDCSGSYIFCASTPGPLGPIDLHVGHDAGAVPSGYACNDLLHSIWPSSHAASAAESTSLICVVDFSSGEQCYQVSINANCISLGSPWHDPGQLLVGARDGTISVWQPPVAVSSRIRTVLQESLEAHSVVRDATRQPDSTFWSLASKLSHVEEAVSFFWATKLHAGMDWQSWGDGVHKPVLPCGTGAQKQTSVAHAVAMDNKPLPLLPILPPAYRAPQPRHEDDVVIQGRQKWAMARSGGEFLRPELQASFPPFTEHLRPQVLQASQALSSPRFGHGPKRFPEPCNPERARALNETEIDPVSGLEMHEIPLNQPGWKHGTMQSQAEMEMAAPTAPEFLEEFGTRAEHFQDPLPSQDATSVPRWLERGRPMPAAQPRLHDHILRSVVSDLDKFEMAHPEVQALESPRSDAELVAVG